MITYRLSVIMMFCLTCINFFLLEGVRCVVQAEEYLSAPNHKYYNDPDDVIKRYQNEYDSTKFASKWIVFADRDKINIYKTKSLKQKIAQANFLDRFMVKDWKNDAIQVEQQGHTYKKIVGWANIHQFVLLSEAWKTKERITHKAVLVNIEKLSRSAQSLKLNPLRSPGGLDNLHADPLHIYKFAFIYKYDNTMSEPYVLVGVRPRFIRLDTKEKSERNIKNVIIGWIPQKSMLIWHTREALELNPDRNIPAYFFTKKEYPVPYYQNFSVANKYPKPVCSIIPGCYNEEDVLVITKDIGKKIDRRLRDSKELPYVILEKNNDPHKPFKIGLPSISVNIPKILRTVSKELDIVFLIDATMSMEPYFDHTSRIAESFMKTFKDKDEDVRFGVAVYRDYNHKYKPRDDNHKQEVFEILVDLTKDIQRIKRNLTNKVKTIPESSDCDINEKDPALYPEAVFQGIKKCILNMDWNSRNDARRLIIHIGDAGNHSRGYDHIDENDLARLLYQEDFSYSAILLLDEKDELKERIKARDQFYLEMKKIIDLTENGWIKNHPTIFNKNQQNMKDHPSEIQEYNNLQVSQYPLYNRGRWVLTSVNTTGGYEQTVKERIESLSKELKHKMAVINNLLKNVRSKKKQKNIVNYSSNQHKHQLEASIIQRSIKKIGEEMLKQIADGDDKIRKRALQIVNKQDLENATRYVQNNRKTLDAVQKNSLDQTIIKIGKSEFWPYMKKNAQSFSTAYVLYNVKQNELFNKVVLLTRKEIEDMLEPLLDFRDKLNGEIERKNIVKILKSFITHIPGEVDDKTTSFEDLYYWQQGISLQHKHDLLKLPIEDIELGIEDFKASKIETLQIELSNTLANLETIYHTKPKGDFQVYGITYYWIPVDYLL